MRTRQQPRPMTATISLAMAAVAASAVVALFSLVATADGRFTRELNIDRSGNDILVKPLPSGSDAAACESLCAATKGCVAFTFVKQSTTVPEPLCRVKDQAPFGHASDCCVSGALVK